MAKRKRILLVDDETKITDVVASYLEKLGYETDCAHSGSEALALFDAHAPDLVILDLMLPRISGEEVCRAIRRISRVPVIMLTAKSSEESILTGLGIGADDYVVKPFSPRQLVARVEAVLRRAEGANTALSNELKFRSGALSIDGMSRCVYIHGNQVALTPAEFNILYTLAKHPTKAFTREELMLLALQDSSAGYDRVIDTHVKNLRQKLDGDAGDGSFIKTVYGIGYALRAESES